MLHRVMFTKLLGFSLVVWLVSIIGSGLAGEWGGSYWLLLCARCLSGVAEASFQCIVPPLIQDRCAEDKEIADRRNSLLMREDLSTGKLSSVEEERERNSSSKPSFDTVSVASGDEQNLSASASSSLSSAVAKPAQDKTSTWLAIYFTAIPTGTALGYIFSSTVSSSSLGWQAAFYIEGLAMVPLVLFCMVLHMSEKTRADIRMSRKGLSEPLIGKGSGGSCGGSGGGSGTVSVQRHKDRRLSRLLEPTGDLAGLKKKVTMADEFYACASSLPFMSVLFSYAAYTAVLISVSTFGSAFVMALGFFNTETSAALVFGGIISIAGVIGTPIGGYVLKKIDHGEQDPPNLLKMSNSFKQLNKQVFVGFILLLPMTFTNSTTIFVVSMLLGCICLFTATVFFNLGAMLCVPKENRSFAIGLLTFGLHAMGDVPSPIVVGWLKDSLAPACDINGDGEFDDLDACRDDSKGIQLTILITFSWLIWVLVFNHVAYKSSRSLWRKDVEKEKSDFNKAGGGAVQGENAVFF